MKQLKTHIIIFLLLLAQFSFAQQISNIHFEQVGKQIHVFYDLVGDGTFNVKIFCSTDSGQSWGKPLQKVSGDVGENQKPGKGKEIVWDVLAEREKISGEVKFKIDVKGQGVTKGGGDQVKPHGYKDSDRYDGQGGKGNGIAFGLGGRGAMYLEKPSAKFTETGTVVVSIWVDPKGKVVRAQVNPKGTTVLGSNLRKIAVDAALNSNFAEDPTAPSQQRGTITYEFVLF